MIDLFFAALIKMMMMPRKIYPQIRWTDLEIQLFIDKLKISGRDWDKISKKVVTKDHDQCRSYDDRLNVRLQATTDQNLD